MTTNRVKTRATFIMVALAGTFSAARAARAADQDTTTPPPASAAPDLPATTPDVDTPANPEAPVHPGEMPPMASPEALPPPAPMPAVEGTTRYPEWMTRVGAAVMLGGGFEDFTHAGVRAVTGGGGSWDARIAAGTRQVVGLEAAYVGAARSIQSFGLQNDTRLVSNGVEGALRLNIPIEMAEGGWLVEPFGFVGIGWQHYSLTRTPATADVTSTDDVMTMPYGGGLEASLRGLLLDARFIGRQTYRNNLFVNGERLNTWGISGNVGFEF